ncbi:MAG: 7-carboxy-7-deazaguanine synthase QueE [Methylococcales bacterium]|nr:7-carboxy-7-deazaguanine synthase QueE [Methylococcales bacterium]MDD5754377.1 7-carboxy-7-deazaguanine synthase QueE [Methylococcales bacterium]
MSVTLRISEIFYSLQGESNTVGLPTVFVRLTGCPLRCNYCDTSYAFSGGVKMSLIDIFAEIKKYDCQYICVTGGEPLAQPGCLELLTQLADANFNVSLETSGALDVSKVDNRIVKVMDLKTPSSHEVEKNRYENINFLTVQDQVKFVIADDEDYDWSKKIIANYDLSKRCHVLFSPVVPQQNPTELAEKILADRLPVRFQIQLHKLLWQDAQGK